MRTEFVDRVFAAKTPENQRDIYDEWAASYEQEIFGNGYRTPAIIAAAFARFVPLDAGPILDAGCGGGLQAEPLAILGYGPLIGIDVSPGMLSVAGSKGIYESLQEMPLDENLPFETHKFSAVISAGVLSPGQAPARALTALARVTQPGGFCVFSLRGGDRTSPDYLETCQDLERQGIWTQRLATGPFQVMPVAEPEGLHEVYVYEVKS